MKTRIANHKTARCETCPHFLALSNLCNLHVHLIHWPAVEADGYCDHHPDNEPLKEGEIPC